MMGQTQRPWVRQNHTSCQTEKKFSPTLRNIYKKQHGAQPCVEKMQLIFFVPPNEELEGRLHPQNLDVPPKMKVKGYMYPQMKKPVGMLIESSDIVNVWSLKSFHFKFIPFVSFWTLLKYSAPYQSPSWDDKTWHSQSMKPSDQDVKPIAGIEYPVKIKNYIFINVQDMA